MSLLYATVIGGIELRSLSKAGYKVQGATSWPNDNPPHFRVTLVRPSIGGIDDKLMADALPGEFQAAAEVLGWAVPVPAQDVPVLSMESARKLAIDDDGFKPGSEC